MAEVLEDISVEDGTEEAVTGEDVAITRTEGTPIPTSVLVCTLTTTLTGIGLRNVILMAGATESGCHIIEGAGYFLKEMLRHLLKLLKLSNRNIGQNHANE